MLINIMKQIHPHKKIKTNHKETDTYTDTDIDTDSDTIHLLKDKYSSINALSRITPETYNCNNITTIIEPPLDDPRHSWDILYCYPTNKRISSITLKINEDSRIYFNDLHLNIFNPENRNIDDLIHSIKFQINGNIINTIYDLNALTQLYTEMGIGTNRNSYPLNDFSLIHLPFLHSLFNIGKYSEVSIIIEFKFILCDKTFQTPVLTGHKLVTDRNMSIQDSQIHIYQQQVIKYAIEPYYNVLYDTLKLKFNGNLYVLYIVCDDWSNIRSLELKFMYSDSKHKHLYTLNELQTFNKSLGYSFNHPTFVFSHFEKNKLITDTTINFNRLKNPELVINYTTPQTKPIEYKVYAINANIIINSGGVNTCLFT